MGLFFLTSYVLVCMKIHHVFYVIQSRGVFIRKGDTSWSEVVFSLSVIISYKKSPIPTHIP